MDTGLGLEAAADKEKDDRTAARQHVRDEWKCEIVSSQNHRHFSNYLRLLPPHFRTRPCMSRVGR